MKKVTIYSSTMGTKVIETQASTFSGLIISMKDADIRYNKSDMKAVIGQTKVTLEHDDAVLPEEDFTLFLVPKKTKSGGVVRDRKECYTLIAALKNDKKTEAAAKAHFGNHTNKSTEELNNLLASFSRTTTTAVVKEEIKKEVAKKVTEVVESVKESKKENSCNCEAKLAKIEKTLKKVVQYIVDEFGAEFGSELLDFAVEEQISEEIKTTESEADRIKREEREAQIALDKKNKAEMDAMMSGF